MTTATGTSLMARSVSPCIGICRLEPESGYCLGCARTGSEIGAWSGLDDTARQAVWAALPARFETLGVTCRRIGWTLDEILAFAADGIARAAGTWVLGVVGAVGEFVPKPGKSASVETNDRTLTARTDGAALRLDFDGTVRALTFDAAEIPDHERRVVLAVQNVRGALPTTSVVTDLGADTAAIDDTGRGEHLFDLGLGRNAARFCIRTGDARLIGLIRRCVGQTMPRALGQIGPALVEASPTRVVETVLGRIEVATRIPKPGGVSPAGPHTHLLHDHLATGRDMPTGMDLPEACLPGAIFYPARPR